MILRPLLKADAAAQAAAGTTRASVAEVGTVIVNRDHVDWILEAVDEEVEMPEIPL